MNDEQQRIWDYLNQNAIGYDSRKSSSEIRDFLKMKSGGPTNEHIRDLIRDMILNHGSYIGSLMYQKGYWIISTKKELEEVIKSLNDRAESINKRAEMIRKNWEKRNE